MHLYASRSACNFAWAALPVRWHAPGFTFAPLLAIALNRQALLVPLHTDHARPLSKLWHGGALGQDHVDLPSFHVQLSPLTDVDILQCQSRRDITPASQMGRRKAPQARSQRRGFGSPIVSLELLLHPPAPSSYLHCKIVPVSPGVSLENMHYPTCQPFLAALNCAGKPLLSLRRHWEIAED